MFVSIISLGPETAEFIKSQHTIFYFISTIYDDTFQDFLVVLFVCLTYLAVINIEAITKDVSTRSFQRRNVSLYWIRQWKKNYFAVKEYVKEVDRFYGPILILIFCKISVHTIVTFYKVVALKSQNEAESPLAYATKTATNILFAVGSIVAAQKMEEKVIWA